MKYNRNNGNSWQFYSKNGHSGKLDWNTSPESLYELLDNASNKSSNDSKTDQKSEEKKNESDKSDHVQNDENIYGRRKSFLNNQTRQTSNVSNTPYFGFFPRNANYISNNNTQVPPPINNTQQTNNQPKSSSKNKEDNGHISLFDK